MKRLLWFSVFVFIIFWLALIDIDAANTMAETGQLEPDPINNFRELRNGVADDNMCLWSYSL